MSTSSSSPSDSSPFTSSSRSSSSSTASPPTCNHSRPSFPISYSQPAPSSYVSQASNAGACAGTDPKPPTGASIFPHRRPPASSSFMSISASSNPQQASKPFVPPAHPQSHHLHSLPPREKTTRTLILDHTAWRHGRTRFAQGRCELGMKYRLKSKERNNELVDAKGKRPGFFIGSSDNSGSGSGFRHFSDFGDPPEVDVASSDEDGEDAIIWESDDEDVRVMGYGKRQRSSSRRRSVAGDTMDVDSDADSSQGDSDDFQQENEMDSEDESVALSLSARAVGMEKVLHAMLIQPPLTPPRSPSPPPYAMQNSQSNGHQTYFTRQSTSASSETIRHLPNGLRLRLALLTVVNDVLERQPPSSVEHSPVTTVDNSFSKASDSKVLSPSAPPAFSSLPPASLPTNTPPAGLATFLQISSQPHYTPPTLPSFHTLSLPTSSALGPVKSFPPRQTPPNNIGVPSGGSVSGSPTGNDQPDLPHRPPPPLFSWKLGSATTPNQGSTPSASSSKPAAYSPWGSPSIDNPAPSTPNAPSTSAKKVSGSVSNFPSSWKDARHHLSNIVKSHIILTKRAAGRSKDIYAAGCHEAPVVANAYKNNIQTFSYRAAPQPLGPSYPLRKLKTLCPRHLKQNCKICDPPSEARGARSPTRIGAGLLRKQGLLIEAGDQDALRLSGSVLADLLPRFLRLSALVAMELGREARGEEPEAIESNEGPQTDSRPPVPLTSGTAKTSPHALPTREWFALLCGLITRGVLEGYVARGWKGSEYVEILMGIGLGIKGVGTRPDSVGFGNGNLPVQEIPFVEDDKNEFEPDEMPGLIDACKVLFNGLVQDAGSAKEVKDKVTRDVEQEYVCVMEERMSEFLNVSQSCPDLATHLTQLSEKYPAEPIERASIRFCEAVAKWRGKPELEMYKKSPARWCTKSQSSTPTALSIDALLADSSTPVPHRPPIHKYFNVTLPVLKPPSAPRGLKRQHSVNEEIRESKKEKVENTSVMDIDFVEQKTEAEGVDCASPSFSNNGAIPDSEWVGPYGV